MGSIATNRVNIVDIRPQKSLGPLVDNIRHSLNPTDGQAKSLSTLLLYNGALFRMPCDPLLRRSREGLENLRGDHIP